MAGQEDDYRSPAGTWEPIRKEVLEDFTLSSSAFQLMGYLATKPSGWVVSEKQLIYASGWSPNRVRTALRELRRRGLVVETVTRGAGGAIERRESALSRRRVVAGQDFDAGNLDVSKPHSSPDLGRQVKPAGGNLNGPDLTQAGLGVGESPPIEKTDLYSEYGGCSEDLKTHDQLPLIVGVASPKPTDDGFETFWAAYPRKVGKKGAKSAYIRALKDADEGAILAGAVRYRDDPHREPPFTKHPSTWLNNGCWDDELMPSRGSNGWPANRQQKNLDARAAYLAGLQETERTAIES